MPSTSEYLLAGSSGEAERLRIQALAWEPQVEIMLTEMGVEPGWCCIDVGCGSQGIIGPLARRVGRGGSVVAFDRNPALLAAARQYCNSEELGNVEFREGDLFAMDLPAGSFDLVHARFVLAPIGRDCELLERMLRLVREGGLIALEEPDATSWTCTPRSPAWDYLKASVLRAFEDSGGDFNAGARLGKLLLGRELRPVHVREAVLTLPGRHPYSRMLIRLAQSLRAKGISPGLAAEAEFQNAVRECEDLLDSPYTFTETFRLVQAWGQHGASGGSRIESDI
jgi:SAM-dependent methyltransferase